MVGNVCTERLGSRGTDRCAKETLYTLLNSGVQSFDKAEPSCQIREKYIRNNLIRIRFSLICKLSGTPD
jgi:hypothetical protein